MTDRDAPESEPRGTDADALARELELELARQRISWQSDRARRGLWRGLSILFLLLVILGTLWAWIFLAPQMRQGRPSHPAEEISP